MFASQRFAAFHRDLMAKLLERGQLLLHWVELDGAAVAAEYHLLGGRTVYAYQAGVDPAALGESPGRLAHIATIRKSIECGYRAFDFLRGDEPYKAHWRATPRGSVEVRVACRRWAAQTRLKLWRGGAWAKRRIRGLKRSA
jgi:CelD/BcsL family acetyltransferase involved in cellulose biosynthesis